MQFVADAGSDLANQSGIGKESSAVVISVTKHACQCRLVQMDIPPVNAENRRGRKLSDSKMHNVQEANTPPWAWGDDSSLQLHQQTMPTLVPGVPPPEVRVMAPPSASISK